MATLRAPVRRSLQQASSAPPSRTVGAWIRHPLQALWQLFSSVRLAIVLISTLLAFSAVGVFITQAPREVISSPSDYAVWLDSSARLEYGNLTDLMNWLRLFTIFTSWYFKLLVVLLAVNILVGGMLMRAPGIWQKVRHSPLKRADGFYLNSPVRQGVTVNAGGTTEVTVEQLRAYFQRQGFRVRSAPESNHEVGYLFVHRNIWSLLSTFVFHTSLIGVMLSAVLTGWSGFGAHSRAQQLLPAPLYNYAQNLAGISYTAPMPNGSMGVVYPLGTPHNIIYRAQQFVMTVDPQRLTPTDFYTDLQVFQDRRLVAQKRIRVNDPLTYQDVTFHQASFMMYTDLQLRDAGGQVIYSGPVPLFDQRSTKPDPNTGNILQTNTAEDVPIASYGDTMNVAVAFAGNGQWLVGIKGYDASSNPLFQGASIFHGPCVDPATNGPVAPGQYGCRLSNGWWLTVNDVRRGTILLVKKDAGSPLLWPIFALMIASVCLTFLFIPRRYWVKVAGDQVWMAALKEHNSNLQRDLDRFARALGNVPLRVAPPLIPTVHKGKRGRA